MPAPQKHHARNQQFSKTKRPPAIVKKAPAKRSATAVVEDCELKVVPLEVQQLVLDTFQSSFVETFGEDLPEKLQQVKTHLFNRDFLKAFERDDLLAAYAVRWSPSRALCYLGVLYDVIGMIPNFKSVNLNSTTNSSSSPGICCVGGGAGAELVSIAAVLRLLRPTNGGSEPVAENIESDISKTANSTASSIVKEDASLKFSVLLMDIAEWGFVNKALYNSLTTSPRLSQYASAAVRAANRPFIPPEALSQALHVTDVLTINPKYLESMLGSHIKLVTIFFTLNELYTTSRARTQAFLLELTTLLQPGALLLVVDSAGSYSTVELNGAPKKYPMQWLLDHTLLKVAATISTEIGDDNEQHVSKEKRESKQECPRWVKLREDESSWFRLPEGLKYPLELEDMRYQLHLYQRLELR
jgi:25S rRNA (uracil2843-N3)-methyltransferase